MNNTIFFNPFLPTQGTYKRAKDGVQFAYGCAGREGTAVGVCSYRSEVLRREELLELLLLLLEEQLLLLLRQHGGPATHKHQQRMYRSHG